MVRDKAGRNKVFKNICLYLTQNLEVNRDKETVITSEMTKQIEVCAPCTQPTKPAIPPTHAVADTGATLVFVLKGTLMRNIWPATNPLTISFARWQSG
jgi:hypothetical protein